jgi:hypothetical protein
MLPAGLYGENGRTRNVKAQPDASLALLIPQSGPEGKHNLEYPARRALCVATSCADICPPQRVLPAATACHCEERSDEAISTPRARNGFVAPAMTG